MMMMRQPQKALFLPRIRQLVFARRLIHKQQQQTVAASTASTTTSSSSSSSNNSTDVTLTDTTTTPITTPIVTTPIITTPITTPIRTITKEPSSWVTRLQSLLEEASGFTALSQLKRHVQIASNEFDGATQIMNECRKHVQQKQTDHERAHKKHVSLLTRRDDWQSDDAQAFVTVTALEVQTRQALHQAQGELKHAEERAVQKQHAYMDAMRKRYHEEQLWQDKWRLMGTYGTWSLIAINTTVFIGGQYYLEQRERKRMTHMENTLHQRLLQIMTNNNNNKNDDVEKESKRKKSASRSHEREQKIQQIRATTEQSSTNSDNASSSWKEWWRKDVEPKINNYTKTVIHGPSVIIGTALGTAIGASCVFIAISILQPQSKP